MKILFTSLFTILFLISLSTGAQSSSVDTDTLPAVEVKASPEYSDASRFPLAPLPELPASVGQVKKSEFTAAGVERVSDITTLDASTSDSYNASGYWDFLNVRGFTLDNRGSYLREGLPINAETSIPLDNKNSVEILKGLSGMQVGSSAPGGLVNFTVLRPPNASSTASAPRAFAGANDEGGWLLGVDAGGRISDSGYRAVAAYEELRPPIENAAGNRYLLSYAQDVVLTSNLLLQFELEHSRRRQPSQGGLSLLGNRIPDPRPRANLNNQAWSQPVEFNALTGTAGLSYNFERSHFSFLIGAQDLLTNDRLAYAYGCSAENNFDRFCSDGSFDVYDFRSDDERRKIESAKFTWDITLDTARVQHSLQLGLLASRSRDRFNKQAYNYVGVGNIDGSPTLPADPALTDENTQRNSDTLDVSVFDMMKWNAWKLWLGARSTHIDRSSVRTDGSRPVSYNKDFVLPWAAVSYDFAQSLVYLSYGEGIETFVTPNRNTYSRPGQFIDDVRSRQYEVGLKHLDGKSWTVALFEIHRPVVTDAAPDFQVDGYALHRGLEASAQQSGARWTLGASTMILEAQRKESRLQPELNNLRPINVPKSSWRAFTEYQWNGHLKSHLRWIYEDDRAITGDNSLTLAAWDRWDLGASFNSTHWQILVLVENVLDKKFWKESPTQYGHIYFYPGQERTWSMNVGYRF